LPAGSKRESYFQKARAYNTGLFLKIFIDGIMSYDVVIIGFNTVFDSKYCSQYQKRLIISFFVEIPTYRALLWN